MPHEIRAVTPALGRCRCCGERHTHVHFIDSSEDFIQKAQRALDLIEHELPACCRHAEQLK